MPSEIQKYQVHFDDPRLRMTLVGRLTVRVVNYVAYLFLLAAVLMLMLSSLEGLRAIGYLLILFLGDRALHWREADRPLDELPAEGKVNAAQYVSPAAFSVLEHAFQRSFLTRSDFFLEIALQLLASPSIREGLHRLDVRPEEFKSKVYELAEAPENKQKISISERREQAEMLAVQAFEQARGNGHRFVAVQDLFSALALVKSGLMDRVFNIFSIAPGDLERALILSSGRNRFIDFVRLPSTVAGFVFESYRPQKHKVMNRAWTARPTPMLDSMSSDFTDRARRGELGFLIGHEEEYRRMVDALSRPSNPNALLIGEAGAGKEAIVAHLALEIVKDRVPAPLFDKRLVVFYLGNLVSGAPPEELQRRLQSVTEEIMTAGNIILCIPDIHNLVKTSGAAYMSAADALMPIINNNAFPIIGSTYPKEFKEFLEPRSDFVNAFEEIRVGEITEAEAEKILVYEALFFEKKSGIVISFGAIKQAVSIAKKYFHIRLLPGSAEELLKDALVDAGRRGEKFLGPDAIIRSAESKINVPIHEAGKAEAETLLNLEEIIHKRFVNQEEAVGVVSDALREYRSGLSRPGGPIASFLFVGPTGVGKTELSKILTAVQFGSEKLMVRFDMSEYQDKESFVRFIGSPDGTVSGSLTEAILQKPYSLVLLDEFEKAYPDILNLFLQVLDDGRLTDNLGRVVDFQNTIIVATSNAHSDIMNEALGKGESMAAIADYMKKRLVDVFKPELLNRFTRIVMFKNLGTDELMKVAELNFQSLVEALAAQGIKITFDPDVTKKIVSWGYDPAFGARPLRRVIEEKLRAPLAEKLLKKEIVKGMDVRVTVAGEEFQFVPGAGGA